MAQFQKKPKNILFALRENDEDRGLLTASQVRLCLY